MSPPRESRHATRAREDVFDRRESRPASNRRESGRPTPPRAGPPARWVTSAPLCRQEAGCRGFEIVLFRAAVGVGTVVDAGPGSGWSEVPVCGCEPAALD